MTAPNGLGNELGTGLGAFAQQFIGTQNTLKQQQDQLAQQQRDNQYRDQQAVAQQQYQQDTLTQNQRQLDAQAARDASNLRANDFTNVVSPAYNTEVQGLGAVLKSYGPQTDKGLPNPNYDPARVAHARDRMKQLTGLMRSVNLNTQNDAGYQPARQALLSFLGVPDDSGTPSTSPASAAPAAGPAPVGSTGGVPDPIPAAPTPQVAAPQVAPPQMDYTFTPSSNPMGVQATPSAPHPTAPSDAAAQPSPAPAQQVTPAPTQVAPTSTPAAPTSTDLKTYGRVQDVPIGQLLTADDASLVKQFGEGADEYARSARGLYKAQQDAAQTAAIAAQNKLWDTKLTAILTDTANPASPTQVAAATTITGFNSKKATGYQLTPEENAQYQQAIVDLAPDVYSPKAWQDVLNSKDDTQITAMYKVFQNVAPGVIPASFDITPYQTRVDDAHTLATATALREKTQNDAAAQAGRIQLALGGSASIGEVVSKKDTVTLRRVAADPDALKLLGYKDGALLLNAADEIDRGVRAGTDKVVNDDSLKLLLGGSASVADVVTKGDSATLRRVAADPAGLKMLGYTDGGHALLAAANQIDRQKTATTDKTLGEVLGVNAASGAKLLAQLSIYPPTMTYDQIVKGSGGEKGVVANLKRLLGVNDNGAANLIQQAQYQYGLGLRGKELTDKLTQARIDTQTSLAGNYDASAGQTRALTGPKVNLVNAQTDVAGARTDQINAAIVDNRNRANAYVDGVRKGTLPLDAAHIAVLAQQTLAYKMKNPRDPLYDPNFAHAASGTFYSDLARQAALYTSQANMAAKQVGLLQKNISAITAKAKAPFGGGTDLSKLSADDQQKLSVLNAQLEKQMQIVAHRSASADQVISDGLKNAPQPTRSTPGPIVPQTAVPGFRTQTDSVANMHGVNPQYLYGFLGAESSGGKNTANYKGLDYQGVGQIGQAAQDDVNKSFGLNLDRTNPTDNMQIAALYMKKQLAKYGGDPVKAYVAYNMGGGALDAHLKANGGKLNLAALPAETVTGIQNLKGYMAGYRLDGSAASPPASLKPTAPAPTAAPAPPKAGTWGPPTAALPAGVKIVGSASQFAQDLRQRGWFTAAAAAKDAPTLQKLIQQATAQVLPTGSAEQRLALQRDLWDSVAGN